MRSTRFQKAVDEKIDAINKKNCDNFLTPSFETNIAILMKLFEKNNTLVDRRVKNNHDPSLQFFIYFVDGLTNSEIINENIIRPLMLTEPIKRDGDILDYLLNHVLHVNETEKTNSIPKIIQAIAYGDTILLADGAEEALILNTKSFMLRGVSEPISEKVLNGPREGFTESILFNLSMVWRRLRTNELKMEFKSVGERSHTQVCVCYLEGLVKKEILSELHRRIEQIHIDGILDSNYISEFIKDKPLSSFYTTGFTERPDIVAAKLLEGRIAVFVDGSPMVLTIPYLFIENFQSNEDYYMNFYYTSFFRMLRIISYILTITIPGIFISIVAFHHEMLPTTLLISLAGERSRVPLSAALELIIMMIIFEIIKETGVRMSSNVGHALSIVGAIVIGQAAVEAGLIAAPVVIIIAFTAITSLMVPRLEGSAIYFRFAILFASSIFGLFGFFAVFSFAVIHIYNLHSFGIPAMPAVEYVQFQNFKDLLFRVPWWMMKERPYRLTNDKLRMKNAGRTQR
ncbi:MAG: Spore germination protein B1 [Firmicutes bacterium ADurb.Bin182]|nr:MAG: Spore germination protein B1 [Firmicutes bacterium ADurb.Bin182]